jgi:hypothetical protein
MRLLRNGEEKKTENTFENFNFDEDNFRGREEKERDFFAFEYKNNFCKNSLEISCPPLCFSNNRISTSFPYETDWPMAKTYCSGTLQNFLTFEKEMKFSAIYKYIRTY